MSIEEADYNLLVDSAKAYIKSLAEIDKLQRELERIENKNLEIKLDDVIKQGWILRSVIDEHPDGELILEKARVKRDAPKQPKEKAPKSHQKTWESDR